MKEFYYINLNPLKKRTGDCVVRALAFFLGIPWKEAFFDLIMFCADKGLVNFNYISTYTAFMKDKGYVRQKPPYKGISIGEFCEKIADEGYVYIIQTKRHMTIICDMDVFDTWDCRDREVIYYWKRQKMNDYGGESCLRRQ